MADDTNMAPQLTLNPTEDAAAAAQAVPELTLDGGAVATPAAPAPEPAKPEVTPVEMDERLLSDQEKQAVAEFSKKIDISDSNMESTPYRFEYLLLYTV